MKYIVTGGAGFIGSNLVDTLLNEGHDVIVIDNESSDAHDKFYWNDKAKNYKLNICDYESTRKLYDEVDAVFHIAAEARIQPCITNPIKAVYTNVLGTATVLQCSREAGVKRIMYSSTSSAYGLKNIPPLKETMSNDCLNPYSVSKTSGEELCKMYSKLFGIETIIFRYFNVYGERHPLKGQYAPVIGIFLRQRAAGEPMTIVGDGDQRRDFTHVSDVVRANILAAQFVAPQYQITNNDSTIEYRGWEWGQVYNIGTGINHSINEIAEMMGGERINIPPRVGESRITLSDSTKANEQLGWKPKVKLEDWINANK
jgi:UDP-glucose 4-epimerase